MFTVLHNFTTANNVLFAKINRLKKNGYPIFLHKEKLDDQYTLDKIVIKSKGKTKNRLVISSGLHGIEGYIGHASVHTFFDNFLDQLHSATEIVIYPTLNPYGMETLQRTNKNNVDLNRNFSKNDFTSQNEKYRSVEDFIEPQEFKNSINFNSYFYLEIGKLMKKHKIKYLNEAFLLGQQSHQQGIYYSGKEFELETEFVLKEFNAFMKSKLPLIWIDIHSGYGPKNQMSIINSRYEIDTTREMIRECDYPAILGIYENDIYDSDGDIIEKLYEIKNEKYSKVDLYATCFEFGTVGSSTLKTVESLKSVVAMNHVRYQNQTQKMKDYAVNLMKRQFAPKRERWRKKAEQDFIQAMNAIIQYKKLV